MNGVNIREQKSLNNQNIKSILIHTVISQSICGNKTMSLREKQSELIAVQQSVGISWQQFKQKFVFNSNSGPDPFNSDSYAIFLPINQPSPSQLLGFTKTQQNICTIFMAELIFKAGQMLKLPVSTTIVTANIAHYYFTRKSFLDTDLRDIAMGAMFLACKSEQTLRRSYQIAAVFDYIFKMFQGIRPIKQLELNSNQYNYMKQKVLTNQNQILFQLGFQVYKLFDIPHRYISGLITSFNKHKECNAIVQHSWTFLNDIYRTKAPVYFPGQVIAAASVFMALQKLKIPMPDKPWWILMEASLQQIKQIFILTNQMYETSNNNQVNVNIVSEILQKNGKKSLKITNVLPVPYYRKIRLDNQGLVMKMIQIEKPIPIIQDKPLQQKQKQSQSDEEIRQNEYGRQKSKKEKKKDKKKHKNHRNDRSKSPQKNKDKEKGRYQNDEDTPKIKKYTPQIGKEKVQQQKIQTKISEIEGQNLAGDAPERKGSEVSLTIPVKDQNTSIKKSVLLDAKSMLSKISMQIKKIEVKNEASLITNQKKQEPEQKQNGKHENGNKGNGKQRIESDSDSDEQDELLAELIQIKKKNLLKKEQTN